METKLRTNNPCHSYTPVTDIGEGTINGQRVGTAENILKTIDTASGLLSIRNINYPVVHSGHSIVYHNPILVGSNTGIYSQIVTQRGKFIALMNEVFSGTHTTANRLEKLAKGQRKWSGIALCVPINENENGVFKPIKLPSVPSISTENEFRTFIAMSDKTINLHRQIIKIWKKDGESILKIPENISEAGNNIFPNWNSHLSPSQANPRFMQFGGEILRQTDIASDIVSSNFVGEKTLHLGQTDIFLAPVQINEILHKKAAVVYTNEKLIVVAQEVYAHFSNEPFQTLRSLSLAVSGILDFDTKLKNLRPDQKLKFAPQDKNSPVIKQFEELSETVISYQKDFLRIL